ncbi:MAG: L,D-transpeptidase [Alphaproteobacteria bacterium]
MDILVSADGWLRWSCQSHEQEPVRCALGRNGLKQDKREGDGATPIGCFSLRRVLFRPDRLAPPATRLPIQPIQPADGWCDDPSDLAYNCPVLLPYSASAESLWREDGLYDLIVILGHNDDPVLPGHGSAIFLHVARADFGPTEGCVAIGKEDLLRLLSVCKPNSRLCIRSGNRK